MATSEAKISEFIERAVEFIKGKILTALSKLGDECVVRIRDRSESESWINRSGNLRSSIGFSVYDHGKKYMETTLGAVLQGAEGVAKRKQMIDSLAKEYAKTFALVVVAAMEYAAEVEAIESKDVLASTKTWATGVVEQRIKTAVEYAIKEINKWKL